MRKQYPCGNYNHPHKGNCRCIKLCIECGWPEASHRTEAIRPTHLGPQERVCVQCGGIYHPDIVGSTEVIVNSIEKVESLSGGRIDIVTASSNLSLCAVCFKASGLNALIESWYKTYITRRKNK